MKVDEPTALEELARAVTALQAEHKALLQHLGLVIENTYVDRYCELHGVPKVRAKCKECGR